MNTFTSGLPTKRASAGVLISDGLGRVLLVEPTYKPYWDIPGGHVEAGESPHTAAAREVKEELGLVLRVGRLLVVDWLPPRPDVTEALMFVFEGQLPDDSAIRLDRVELRSWAWSTPHEIAARTAHAPMLRRRIWAALTARSIGGTAYLDAGQEVTL